MIAVVFSLLTCLAWGGSEFLGGMKSRSVPVLIMLLIIEVSGMIVVVPALLLYGGSILDVRHFMFAIAAGCVGITGLGCVFRGMAVGSIGVISLISSTSAAIPIFFDLLTGNRLSLFQFSGIGLVLAGISFLSIERFSTKNNKRMTAGIGFAISGAVLIGTYFVFIDIASNQDPYWASFILRLATIVLVGSLLAIRRPSYKLKGSDLPVLCVVGILDTIGVIIFNVATTLGLVSIVSVVSSLYPVVAIFLAQLFLKEKMSMFQKVGAVIALGGVVMISGG
ncbi:MAG: DMT family transporter [Desulfobacterales bacterium]|nr:DMT family transporter [Desulfobacterales bacterium]